jgi:protein transport protein SEC24
MENFGDRILAIWMAKGFYHFATYNTDPPSLTVSANLPYPADSEGTWVYLYYSYKRFAESEGRAIAFAGIFQSISQIEINEQVVHNPLNDYLLFTVGHAGSNYKNFNGQITSVKLNLGPGAFIESKAELSEYQRGHFP